MSQELVSEIKSLTKKLKSTEDQLRDERSLREYREKTIAYITKNPVAQEAVDPVSRVAKALFDGHPHRHPNGTVPQWDLQPPHLQEVWKTKARTAMAGGADASRSYEKLIYDGARDLAELGKKDANALCVKLELMGVSPAMNTTVMLALTSEDYNETLYRGAMVDEGVVEALKECLRLVHGFDR